MDKKNILMACAALGAGEWAASYVPTWCWCWPALAVALVVLTLFGFGLNLCGWHVVALFLCGAALFFRASVESETMYRDSPWLRNAGRPATEEPVGEAYRKELSKRIGIGLARNRLSTSLNRAILLGERRRLPSKVRQAFVGSGTMHVFAISGLHVIVIAKLLLVVLVLCQVPYRIAGIVALVPLWCYVTVVGQAASAVRAALMASVCFVAPALGRRPDPLQAWAIAFLTMHVCNPRQIVDVGSALSFVVMLAILLAIRVGSGLGFGLKMALWVTVAAWLAGLPISAHVFGQVTPGGLLAGIPLMAAAQLAVVTGFLGLMASYVCLPLAAYLNNLTAILTDAMAGLAGVVAELPGASLETEPWPVWLCVSWYLAFGLVFAAIRFVRSVRGRRFDIIRI